MSRIGKQNIYLNDKISTEIQENTIKITGPKGELYHKLPPCIKVQKENHTLKILKNGNTKTTQELHGLHRTLINNMVIGVTKGFSKRLDIQGVGYRAQTDKNILILNIGYSHPVYVKSPSDINIKVENNTQIIISGINKETVGQIAAQIRDMRPPEPYKGKGIRYDKEQVRKKVGKAGK
uniref:Ribosomal protein L6 n=1 Tax=Renouxia sp. TaxID=2485823 RepID=A0A3G3MHC4_9FLOR|nr:ribosomal protein L6 [Renouxia sp.]